MSTDYAGNPNNLAVTIPIPVDGVDAPTFVNIEAPVQLNRDAIAFLLASIAQDWRGEFPASSIIAAGTSPVLQTISAAAWDPIERVWLLGGSDNSGVDALFTSFGVDDGHVTNVSTGATWNLVGSTSLSIVEQMAVLADEHIGSRYWTAIAPNGGGVSVHSWLGGSATLQHSFAPSGTLFPEMLFFNGRVIVAIGSTTSASVSINSAAATAPGTWLGNLTPGVAVKNWLLKTDKVWPGTGSIAIAMPYGSNRTATPNYWTSTDGSTWTSQSFSTTLLAGSATDTVVGLCWSPVRALWFCVVNLEAGSGLRVFTSPDGITWTVVTMVSTLYVDASIADIAPLGSMLLATIVNVSTEGHQFLLSPDGGATWYLIAANLSTSMTSGGSQAIRAKLVAGNNGLFAINNFWARFSRFLGLPGVAQ